MARRLIGRKKLEEALELLNETIRFDPRYAESFENRAEVFDLMGMYPQAQADRRKAAGLRAAYPAPPQPPESEPPAPETEPPVAPPPAVTDEEPEEGSLPEVSEPEEEEAVEPEEPEEEVADVFEEPEPEPVDAGFGEPPAPPPVVPAYRPPRRPSFVGAFLRAAAVVLFALGVFVIAGVGIYIALQEIQGDDDGNNGGSVAPSETPAASGSPSATGEGTPTEGATDVPETVEEALQGDPFSFDDIEAAWSGRDLTATVGEISEAVTGFSRPAVDVTLTREGASMELSVIIYGSRDEIGQDWTLGANPAPRGDTQLPPGSSVWYNVNTVVIVRVSHDALRDDARDGYFEAAG
jgi:hypothetical protein